jgi:hypothetical protein
MGSATHLALHPFDRVPILQHGDFTLYETAQSRPTSMKRSKARPCSPKRRGPAPA